MLKAQLQKMIDKKINQRKALKDKADKATTVEELRNIQSEADALGSEIDELRSILNSKEDDIDGAGDDDEDINNRSKNLGGGFNPLSTYGMRDRNNNLGNDLEYRTAFMKCVLGGTPIPDDVVPAEERAAATTVTSDIGVLIPKTVMNKIIEKLKFYGNIFTRVTITNIKGGVSIPKASAKPVATWVSEGKVADKQKKEVKGSVVFAYHKLQCRVAVSLEADTTSLAIFESTVIDNVSEAMIIAIEEAIIKGSGTGQPLGIINDTSIEESQKIAVAEKDLGSWKSWSKILAKVP
ncbi:phage major capsid protein, partial [Clostridium perfringens]